MHSKAGREERELTCRSVGVGGRSVAEQYRCPDVQISGRTEGVSKLHLGWYCVKGERETERERDKSEWDTAVFHVQDT
jgi:hypothetical protein